MWITRVLRKNDKGRMAAKHWAMARKLRVTDDGTKEILDRFGISCEDANEFVKEKREKIHFEYQEMFPRPPVNDESHPDWHEEKCYFYKNSSTLPDGMKQALFLTNSVMRDGLPESVTRLIGHSEIPEQDQLVSRSVLHSFLHDAYQVKLPRTFKKHGIVLPREYGSPLQRKHSNLVFEMFRFCESFMGKYPDLLDRSTVYHPAIKFPVRRNGDLILYTIFSVLAHFSSKPLQPPASPEEVEKTSEEPLVDIYPILPTLNLKHENIYRCEYVYPVDNSYIHPHLHTVFMPPITKYDKLHGDQFESRTMVSAFAWAYAQARHLYGESREILPSPVTVQCIQTENNKFHFAVFQLNTLNLDDSVKNIFWLTPTLKLFSRCETENGRSVLEGYNPEVFQMLLAFYLNGSEL